MSDEQLPKWNIPYGDVPGAGTPDEQTIGLDECVITDGVVVTSSVLRDHGIPQLSSPHPILLFRFRGVDGMVTPIALVVGEDQLRDVKTLVSQAIDGALNAARKERKRGPKG
jgi:hypothetical protein